MKRARMVRESYPHQTLHAQVSSPAVKWSRLHRAVSIFWHEAYRPPLTGLELSGTFNPRRSDLALWYLLDARILNEEEIRRPAPVAFEDLARVHSAAYLESLLSASALATIFAVDPADVPVDALLESVRLACGGT